MLEPVFGYVSYIETTPEQRCGILSGGRQGWPAILSSLKSLLETEQFSLSR